MTTQEDAPLPIAEREAAALAALAGTPAARTGEDAQPVPGALRPLNPEDRLRRGPGFLPA